MEDISLHILDIAQNSIAAGATRITIRIQDNAAEDILLLEIEDNGRGIPREQLAKVLDPFYTSRTTRNVGLGLSLLAQSAKETGGDVSVESEEGKGTTVRARFRPSHIDMKPLGDIADTLLALIAGSPAIDFLFLYENSAGNYMLDTGRIKEVLEEVPITSPDVLSLLKGELKSSLPVRVSRGDERREARDGKSGP